MKKSKIFKTYITFLISLILLCGLAFYNPSVKKVEATERVPSVSIVSLDHIPFVEGDKNEFLIASTNYTGKVQYQLFYTCETTMGSKWQLINLSGMTNGWTTPVDAQQPINLDISTLDLKADYYRFAIRVRRIGVKGKYSNSYGDYDSAYPFVVDVLKNTDINLNGDIEINKDDFTDKESLKISGVHNSSSNIKYKLHLYDVKNNKWLTNLTNYSDTLEYNLSSLPEGPYIVDIWGKKDESNAKYDGWKLKIINVKKETVPKVAIVSLDHYPFVEGDKNEFFISSEKYTGLVQYQLFYTCQTTMGSNWELINNEQMENSWTKPVNAHEPIKVDISSLNLKSDFYRFAIRVRRVGVEGRYKNQYGDYDDAYPFNVTVSKEADINLGGNMVLSKTDFAKNDNLIISGVENIAKDTQYKLHFYDVVNNKWFTNLTDYTDKIDYDLSDLPIGTYVVDLWCKNSNSTKKYDGWKLKVINITSDIIAVSNVDNIEATTSRNLRYSLPETVNVVLEDGSSKYKPITWNKTPNTKKVGVYEFQGTVLGYDKKVKLTLTVEETIGNSSGNIANLGFVAESNGWIYYSNSTDNDKLYKSTENQDKIVKIGDDIPLYINVLGDWIYYSNLSDEGKLYKIKIDGTQRTKLTNTIVEEIRVENEWIYYLNASQDYEIYKIKTNGTSNTKLTNDMCGNLNIEDDFIYYTNYEDENNIYRIRKDGVGRTKLGNDIAEFINVVNGYIYYVNISDSYKIYKIKTNGTGRQKVTDEQAIFINVANDYIYYTDGADASLHKIKIDGTSKNAVYTGFAVCPNIIGNYAYYLQDDEYIHRTSLLNLNSNYGIFGKSFTSVDTLEKSVLKYGKCELPSEVRAFTANGASEYLPIKWDISEIDTSTAGQYIYEGTVKGYNEKVILKVNVVEITSVSYAYIEKTVPKGTGVDRPNYTYVTATDGNRYECKIEWDAQLQCNDPGEHTYEGTIKGYDKKLIYKLNVIFNEDIPTGPVIAKDGEWIYYRNVYGSQIYRIKQDGTGKMKITDDSAWYYQHTNLEYSNGWIYYNSYNGNLQKIKGDGSEKTVLSTLDTHKGVSELVVDGEYIYFTCGNVGNDIRKIKIDGTDETLLTHTEVVYNLSVKDGWVYYTNNYLENALYKIKADGTEKTKVSEAKVYSFVIQDNYMYYTNSSGINRMNLDGTNILTITPSGHGDIKILGNWIYYLNSADSKIYKIKTDGSNETKLNDASASDYFISDEWIYYLNKKDYDRMYKMKPDGSENQIVG